MTDLERLEELNQQLTGDMLVDMDIKQEIHELEMKLNGTKPEDSYFACENCGS